MAERRLTVSEEDAARIREIEALAAEGAAAVPTLIAQLTDRSWAVRRSAVGALAALGDAAVPALCAVLRQQRDDEARLAATVDALAASRGDADACVMALVDATAAPALVCDAAQVLGRRKTRGAIPLLEELTRHHDDNVAVAAVEALGRIGDRAGIGALLALCDSGNFFRVFPVIDVLGRSGDPRAVPVLVRLLWNSMFAAEAARALGRTGDERAVEPLAGMLGGAHDAQVRIAAAALVDLREAYRQRYGDGDAIDQAVARHAPATAAAALARALPSADAAERRAIAQLFGSLGGEDAVAALFQLVSAGGDVAAIASASLKRLRAAIDARLLPELRAGDSERRLAFLPLVGGRAAAVRDVIACLDDADPAVRVAACEALGRIGDTQAVSRLFDALADRDARVAQAALGAIQSLGSATTEARTLDAARSPNPAVRRAALRIIAYFGYASGFDVLVAAINDPDARLREAAIAGLAFVDRPEATATLLQARSDGDPKIRAAALRALGQIATTPTIVAALRQGCADADAWVRYYAAQALGRLRDDASTAVLVALLDDSAGQVRVAAVEALARLATDGAFAALVRTVRADDVDLRRAALVGLGHSRRDEAVPMLLEAAASSDAATRVVAVSALAEFATPEVARALRRAASDDDATVRSAAVELLSARHGVLATRLVAELLDDGELRDRVLRALAVAVPGRVDGLVAALEEAPAPRALLLAGVLARMNRPDAEAALIEILRGGATAARVAAAEMLGSVAGAAAHEALLAASARDSDVAVRRAAALSLER